MVMTLGCAPPKVSGLVPVKGRIRVGQFAAAGAAVAFHRLDNAGGPAACGVACTEVDGTFIVTTARPGDGLAPGVYAVTVVWIDPFAEFDECTCDNPLQHDLLGGNYADPAHTLLHVEVKSGIVPLEWTLTPRGPRDLRTTLPQSP